MKVETFIKRHQFDNQQFKSSIPEGISGKWAVEKFEITKQESDFHNLRCAINPHHSAGREIEPGTYTRLVRQGCFNDVIMSDTPAEIKDFLPVLSFAKGNVLVIGLGLAITTLAFAQKKQVKSVTVVENSQDVINLVFPHISNTKVKIIFGDGYEWNPSARLAELGIKKFDFVFSDIWDGYGAGFDSEETKMKRHYEKYCINHKTWLELVKKRLRSGE